MPKISWFENAKLNLTENIFERLLPTHENKTAIIWEPNDPRKNPIPDLWRLFKATCKFANAMKSQGSKKGIVLSFICLWYPKLLLPCWLVRALGRSLCCFCWFFFFCLADRINDCQAKMILTSDGNFRGNKNIPVKAVLDEALNNTEFVEKVIVLKRTGEPVDMIPGRDSGG